MAQVDWKGTKTKQKKNSRNFFRNLPSPPTSGSRPEESEVGEGRRENEVLKLLFSPLFLPPSLSLSPPFSRKRNKKRPFTGYVFHFKTQVQRHWEIWALCVGLRAMMRGEEQHPIPNSFLVYSAKKSLQSRRL